MWRMVNYRELISIAHILFSCNSDILTSHVLSVAAWDYLMFRAPLIVMYAACVLCSLLRFGHLVVGTSGVVSGY